MCICIGRTREVNAADIYNSTFPCDAFLEMKSPTRATIAAWGLGLEARSVCLAWNVASRRGGASATVGLGAALFLLLELLNLMVSRCGTRETGSGNISTSHRFGGCLRVLGDGRGSVV